MQREWLLAQAGAQPLPTDEMKLNYLNFYGNLLQIADAQMGAVIESLSSHNAVNETMFVSAGDHGEMGLSHGGTLGGDLSFTARLPAGVYALCLLHLAPYTNVPVGVPTRFA